jgi:hypothetical protein
MPMASQLYQNAIAMGASPTLAAYLAGSAYQESSFNPNARGDFVNGKPTSFGVMQVGSPSLGSGSVPDQFKNYITALQSKAPDTWASMNAAPTPQAAHAALHENPDWRMGIPGARFDNAQQLMGTDTSGYQNAPAYLRPNPPAQPTTWQQIMGQLASPPSQQPVLNTGGYSNLPAYLAQGQPAAAPIPQPPAVGIGGAHAMGSWQDYATALQNPPPAQASPYAQGGAIIGNALSQAGQQIQRQGQQGMSQAMAMLQNRPNALQRLLSGGGYPDYTSYLNAQPQGYARGGVVRRLPGYQTGAMVPGRPTGMDSVPAMLTPGEMILNRRQQQAVTPIRGMASSLRPDQLQALARARSRLRGYQTGGVVPSQARFGQEGIRRPDIYGFHVVPFGFDPTAVDPRVAPNPVPGFDVGSVMPPEALAGRLSTDIGQMAPPGYHYGIPDAGPTMVAPNALSIMLPRTEENRQRILDFINSYKQVPAENI